MLRKRLIEAGEGLVVAGQRAEVVFDMVGRRRTQDDAEQELDRRDGERVRLGEAVDGIYLMLDDILAGMKLGETCDVTLDPHSVGTTEATPPNPKAMLAESVTVYSLHMRWFCRAKERWELNEEELLSLGTCHKEKGTELFRDGRIRAAAVCYSRAIQFVIPVHPDGSAGEERRRLREALLLNLAACQLKLGLPQHTHTNCSKVLVENPGSVKALYRRGVASMQLGDLDQAWGDLQGAKRLDGRSRAVQEQLREVARRRREEDTRLGQALKGMFSGD